MQIDCNRVVLLGIDSTRSFYFAVQQLSCHAGVHDSRVTELPVSLANNVDFLRRLPKLDRITGIFARLEDAIDFDAIDDAPVDLVFLLLTPEDAGADHLKALARVSRLMRNVGMCEKLRAAPDKAALDALLTEPTATFQAA